MGYDFHKLKTIDCFNCVTIRVPKRWDCRLRGASWCCSEEDVDSGTLWITVDHWFLPEGSPHDDIPTNPNFDSLQFASQIIERHVDHPPLIDGKLLDVEHGHLWRRVFDGTEDGEWLRFFRYSFFLFGQRAVAYIDFNLVVLRSLADDPEFRDLVAIIDREIRAARLEPFCREQDEADERRFGPLRILNFADWVKLEVPETLVERPESESRYTWQFAFDPEPAGARLWVDVKDNPIKDDAGARRTLEDEEYEDSIRQSLSDRSDAREVLRVPGGILVHDVLDTPANSRQAAEGEYYWSAVPGYKHFWRYFRFSPGNVRVAGFLFIIPFEKKATPECEAAIRLLDRKMRRLQFPGLD